MKYFTADELDNMFFVCGNNMQHTQNKWLYSNNKNKNI